MNIKHRRNVFMGCLIAAFLVVSLLANLTWQSPVVVAQQSANQPTTAPEWKNMEVPPSMGTATAINFQPTGDGKAAITGDFVLIATEVNPVIRTLHQNGIEVTALHSHMLDETPRTLYMHFWANDDAMKLARGLRAALDQTHSKQN
jgi:Domain of Unknown Function (DUF1259)